MTIRGSIILATAGSLILAGGILAASAAPTNSPDFKEVYQLLKAHLPGATDESLNGAAVTGLLEQLNGKATLVGAATAPGTNPASFKASILDQSIDYVRLGELTDDLAGQIKAANAAVSSNKLAGTILDLRFAGGSAYGSIKDAATGLGTNKTPVIVLVNGATRGAAEVLAAELRESGALLIGNATAGLAMTTEEFPLANGEHLRLATTPIQRHGTDMAALQPDILVKVGLKEERNFLENPYGPAGQADGGATNNFTPLLDHTTEADLVRQKRKDGDNDENPEPPLKTEPLQPVLRDPVLARAVDLVKGLAVMRESHP